MDTLRESALRLLHDLLWPPGRDPGALDPHRLALERGRASGTLGALLSVGAISVEEAEEWRARFAAGARVPGVGDAGTREEASRVLGAFLHAVEAEGEDGDGRAGERYSGALSALAEIGAVDRFEWSATFVSQGVVLGPGLDGEGCEPVERYRRLGTDQELVGVIAGPSELLEGWRVLYGLRFTDDVVFLCWNEAIANWFHDDDLDHEDSEDPSGFHLSDNLATHYGGGDAWGDSGFQGVSFPTEGSVDTPAWMVLISRYGNGNSLRVPI